MAFEINSSGFVQFNKYKSEYFDNKLIGEFSYGYGNFIQLYIHSLLFLKVNLEVKFNEKIIKYLYHKSLNELLNYTPEYQHFKLVSKKEINIDFYKFDEKNLSIQFYSEEDLDNSFKGEIDEHQEN